MIDDLLHRAVQYLRIKHLASLTSFKGRF